MWFKNLLIYSFTQPFPWTAEQLHEKLQERSFSPCGSQELSSLGWVSPLGEQGSEYVHSNNSCLMICCLRQERVLPSAVVNDALAERVRDIKQRDDRSPGRKERLEIKEQLVFEMLPRAFTKSRRLFAYIDPVSGWLVVDTASHKQAEALLQLLRETLGSLPVIPQVANNTLQQVLTGWLTGPVPGQFVLGGECELVDAADEKAVIRCKNQNLVSSEILSHIRGGMLVTKLALGWIGDIECVVDAQLVIRRLRFGDLIMERVQDVQTDSAAEQFDVDFAIMNAELRRFVPALLDALGLPTG